MPSTTNVSSSSVAKYGCFGLSATHLYCGEVKIVNNIHMNYNTTVYVANTTKLQDVMKYYDSIYFGEIAKNFSSLKPYIGFQNHNPDDSAYQASGLTLTLAAANVSFGI